MGSAGVARTTRGRELASWQGVLASGEAGAGRTKQHAGKGWAARAMQQRAGWRRTSHHDRASSEEQEEERSGCPPGKMASQSVYEATFSPPQPCLQPHARPGRKADLHFGRRHAGRTPGKERAACADAEISILMQHNAENK